MDRNKTRRERLAQLIEDKYKGDRQKLCDACGYSDSRIAQLLSSKYRDGNGFGEKAARTLEEKLGLNPYFFDGETKTNQSNVTSIYKRAPQTRFEWLDLATTKATLALREDAIKGSKLSLLIWYFYEELVDNKGEDITPEKTERIIKLVANSR